MEKTYKKQPLLVALVVVTLAFIWGNSLLPGSVSGAISDWVQHLINALLGNFGSSGLSESGLLRKCAHATEFAALGVELALLTRRQRRSTIWAVLLSGLSVALCDETIQLFVSNRAGQVKDVWIDFGGFLTGLSLTCLILWLHNRHAAPRK